MGILTEILQDLPQVLEEDSEYKVLAEWLTAKILFEMDEEKYTIHAYKGRIIEVETGESVTGTDFTLVGPQEEWQRLLGGEIKLAQGLNFYHGKFSLRGNLIMAGNNMRALSYIIKKMQPLYSKMGGNFHAEKS